MAKIASEQRKPNGQFHIENDRQVIMEFMAKLPISEVRRLES